MRIFENPSSGIERMCVTCKHWEKSSIGTKGRCPVNEDFERARGDQEIIVPMMTLDFSVCSKWLEKENPFKDYVLDIETGIAYKAKIAVEEKVDG